MMCLSLLKKNMGHILLATHFLTFFLCTTLNAQDNNSESSYPEETTGEADQNEGNTKKIVRKFIFMDENGETTAGDLTNEMDIEVITDGTMQHIPMIDGAALPMINEAHRIHGGVLRLPIEASVTVSTSGDENSVSIIQQQGGFWYVEDNRGQDSFVFCNVIDSKPSCQNVDITNE
jgi:hypothetical protein